MDPNPLSQLRDIHLPSDPGLTPAFFGIALTTLVLIMLCGLAAAAIRHRRRGVKAEALRLLDGARDLPNPDSLLAQAKLLRRLARSVSGSDAVKLQGRDWLGHLDRMFSTDFFTSGGGQIFGDSLYRPAERSDAQSIAAALRQLIGTLKC